MKTQKLYLDTTSIEAGLKVNTEKNKCMVCLIARMEDKIMI